MSEQVIAQHTPVGDGTEIAVTAEWWWRAQTFKPLLTGQVTRVELALVRTTFTGDLVASIRDTLLGKPTGADLCAKSQPYTDGFMFIFPSTPTLTQGIQYALQIRGDTGALGVMLWNRLNGDPYADGTDVYSTDTGATWTINAAADFLFTVWGNVDDTDPETLKVGKVYPHRRRRLVAPVMASMAIPAFRRRFYPALWTEKGGK